MGLIINPKKWYESQISSFGKYANIHVYITTICLLTPGGHKPPLLGCQAMVKYIISTINSAF